MEAFTKTVPLTFNKLFFLSPNEPSDFITKSESFDYAANSREDISDCINANLPPLLRKEIYNAFWLDSSFCDDLKTFDLCYPYSKFILIRNKSADLSFYKNILKYFCNESFAEKYLTIRCVEYNDILSSDIEEPKSSKFIIFNEDLDDQEKINEFLSDPVIA